MAVINLHLVDMIDRAAQGLNKLKAKKTLTKTEYRQGLDKAASIVDGAISLFHAMDDFGEFTDISNNGVIAKAILANLVNIKDLEAWLEWSKTINPQHDIDGKEAYDRISKGINLSRPVYVAYEKLVETVAETANALSANAIANGVAISEFLDWVVSLVNKVAGSVLKWGLIIGGVGGGLLLFFNYLSGRSDEK